MIKKVSFILFCFSINIFSQVGRDGNEQFDLGKVSSIRDRAGGTHNASSIGLFFENRGKLYPRRITQGPSGEFPINSGKHYIYRINPMVGIPGNVIQGRYTDDEEWEAVGGFQNPDLSQIAFSDNPATWHPVNGWPVKDANGNPLIYSDQDSYCAYNDSNNTVNILGIQVEQIGYAYGVKFAQNLLFFKYLIINKSEQEYDSLYFSLYSDIDIGNISGGAPEYDDDKLDFIKDKNFVYFYDSDNYSSEWPNGKVGMMGVVLLQTPMVNGVQLGLTDMHYNLYYDDRDIDTVQYGIMSSSRSLFNSSLGGAYFHLGSNTTLNYDDPATIPEAGLDLVANLASGPYVLSSGDTLVFITAVVAGETKEELFYSLDQAFKILQFNFEVSKPPATPSLYAFAGDKQVTLYWNDAAEYSQDSFSGEYDFEGYRVYKSVDKGITWELLADFDKINDIGLDRGLQYSYTDTKVVNGIEYWYSVTAYDRGDELLESLETPKGTNPTAINLSSVIPMSNALGRTPVTSEKAYKTWGNSNYVLIPKPVDDQTLSGNYYNIFFNYITRTDKGKLKTQVTVNVFDSTKTIPHHYGLIFKTNRTFDIVDITTGDVLKEDNTYIPRAFPGVIYSRNGSVIPGMEFRLYDPNPAAPSDSLPASNDRLTINYSINAVRNNSDTVLSNRPFDLNQVQSTTDGVILELKQPDIIESVSRVGGADTFEIEFTVEDEAQVLNALYVVSVTSKGFDQSNEGIISLLVKRDTFELTYNDLKNLSTFTFNGIKGHVKFPSNNPPSPGNIFSLKTVIPLRPNVQDRFQFTLKAPVLNNKIVKQEINKIKVVPNPYVASSLYEPEFGELRREPLRQIQFINLPQECTIHIFTVDADLVKTLNHNGTTGTEIWDLRTEGGREIASGMYIYVVKTQEAEFKERFAVIK